MNLSFSSTGYQPRRKCLVLTNWRGNCAGLNVKNLNGKKERETELNGGGDWQDFNEV